MARKKQPKRNWLRTVILLLAIPLIVWIASFLVWLYWDDINGRAAKEPPAKPAPKTARPMKSEESRQGIKRERPKEKITEEDRRKLEDVLKKRN